MKASMNGAINLSILDGWWDEGYDGGNGWAIKPASDHVDQEKRNADESRTLYELLQDHVIPLYYARDGLAYSPGWVAMAKRAMSSILPHFSARRMLDEYVSKFYVPASLGGRRYTANGWGHGARTSRLEGARARGVARRRAAPPGRAGGAHRVRRDGEGRGGGDAERSLHRRRRRGPHAAPDARSQPAVAAAQPRAVGGHPTAPRTTSSSSRRTSAASSTTGSGRTRTIPGSRTPSRSG